MASVPRCAEKFDLSNDIFMTALYPPLPPILASARGHVAVLGWFDSNETECSVCNELCSNMADGICNMCSRIIGECTQCHKIKNIFNDSYLCYECLTRESECTQCQKIQTIWCLFDGICLTCEKHNARRECIVCKRLKILNMPSEMCNRCELDNARRECVVCKRLKILNIPSHMCNKCESESDIIFECSKCHDMDVLFEDLCRICYVENNSLDNVD